MSVRRMGARAALAAVIWAVGLLAGAGSAVAEEVKFTFTEKEQEFKVPSGVTSLQIEAAGAQGGTGATINPESKPGGPGARLVATFTVTGGETLNVLVGGKGATGGEQCEGGGGGGSFVDSSATTAGLLLAAAGGGGGSIAETGTAGSATEGAAKGGGAFGGAAGTLGNGGAAGGDEAGAGGGGLLTPGGTAGIASGGKSLAEGGAGGACSKGFGGEGAGGFGGGGGAGFPAGGGGGGYNGGGGGGRESFAFETVAGGGGGSFSASTPSVAESGVHNGNGLVTITYTMPTSASALAATLVSDSIGKGPGHALADKAAAIQAAVNAGQTAVACEDITGYLGLVKAQTEKKLTKTQASELTTDATNLAAALGC